MIIACPACATRYVVPDSAIGPEGRTVRCAKCKHSWYQDGPELAEPVAAPAVAARPPERAAAAPGPVARSQATAPSSRPASDQGEAHATDGQRAAASVVADEDGLHDDISEAPHSPAPFDQDIRADWDEDEAEPAESSPPAALEEHATGDGGPQDEIPPPVEWAGRVTDHGSDLGDDVSHFDHQPPFRPRRNWMRWLTWGAGAFAALALAGVVAMQYFGLPSWLPIDRPMFGPNPGLEVEFPASEQERRTLPNGSEFFGARVVVKNTTRETKTVPPLLIVLLDARERVVYSWELIPPQRSLAPGEEQTINEAMTDVPKSAVYADIGWAPR